MYPPNLQSHQQQTGFGFGSGFFILFRVNSARWASAQRHPDGGGVSTPYRWSSPAAVRFLGGGLGNDGWIYVYVYDAAHVTPPHHRYT